MEEDWKISWLFYVMILGFVLFNSFSFCCTSCFILKSCFLVCPTPPPKPMTILNTFTHLFEKQKMNKLMLPPIFYPFDKVHCVSGFCVHVKYLTWQSVGFTRQQCADVAMLAGHDCDRQPSLVRYMKQNATVLPSKDCVGPGVVDIDLHHCLT